MQRFQLRLVLLLICGLNFDATALTAGDPIPVIFDTDITGDVDDVLALAMLHALADRGECNIEAITISKIHPQVVAFVDAVNTFYGRPDLAIGMTRDSQHRFSKYLDLVSARSGTELRYPHDLASNDQVPDAVTVLRRTLANAEDRSVVVIQVGLATNLADLLDSSADDICPLSGPELIRQKVRLVSIMAGAFSPVKGNDRYLEANVRNGIGSMQRFTRGWPDDVSIVWSDFQIGIDAPYPRESIARDFGYVSKHIVREAYLRHSGPNHDRPSWDLTSVLFAVRPDDHYFELSQPGRVEVADDGFTQFEPATDGRDRYLILPSSAISRVVATQRLLVSQPPLNRN